MDINEIEDYYLEQKIQGMDFSQIRKELRQKGLAPAQVNALVRSIDHKILMGAYKKQESSRKIGLMMIGGILAGIGLVVTIGTFTGIIDIGNRFIFSYGPMLSGVALIFSSNYQGRTNLFDRNRKFDR